MPNQAIATDRAPSPAGAYSQGIQRGEWVFTAGQVGKDAHGALADGLAAQVEQAIRNVEAVLVAAGTTLDSVVKTSCFLRDITDFAEFNRTYERCMRTPLPARTTIGAQLPPGVLFQIEAVAALPDTDPSAYRSKTEPK